YLIDPTELRSIVGRTDLELEEIAGRGIIKLEDAALFQAALPAEGEEALDVIDNMQAKAKSMDEHWDGERPEEIPMMPDGAIDFADVKENIHAKNIEEKGLLAFGSAFEEVTPVDYKSMKHNFLAVSSHRRDGMDRLAGAMAKNMSLINDSY